MGLTIKALGAGTIGSGSASTLVAAQNAPTLVTSLTFTNRHTATVRVKLKLTTGSGDRWLTETAGISVPAKTVVKFAEEITMDSTGQTITGQTDAGTDYIAFVASGLLKT